MRSIKKKIIRKGISTTIISRDPVNRTTARLKRETRYKLPKDSGVSTLSSRVIISEQADPVKEREKAYNYATWLLGQRLRTEKEIWLKLRSKQYSESVADSVVLQLKQERYLNDERLVEAVITSFKAYKPYGYYMVKKKLIMRFFSTQVITDALQQHFTEADEVKIAKRALKQRTRLSGESVVSEKDLASLQRRGFRLSVIQKIKL
ncbi:MAG TPA: RecX family transcriptional regulator [Patescibacteria group bacterium]|nr:RecX family transcriptional regulator [Patescibacteria group bacterium]